MYFSKDWLPLVELSFRNFLAEAIEHLPLPTLLRFDSDRLQRSALQKQVERLQSETAGLRQQLAASSKDVSNQQDTQQSQQHQQSYQEPSTSRLKDPMQHCFRSGQDSKAAGPVVAPKHSLQSQNASGNACSTASAAETSDWVLADEQESSQSPTASESAAVGRNQYRSSHTEPTLSTSLASLAASVLADSKSEAPQQQTSVTGEPLSPGAGASSLHLHKSKRQLSSQAGSSEVIAEGVHVQSSRSGSGQGNLSIVKQQTAQDQPQPSEAGPSKDCQHQAQQGSEAVSLHRQTDNASELASDLNGANAEQLAGHDGGVTCCSFSPNGQNLATASIDGVVRISAPASLQVQPSLPVAAHHVPSCIRSPCTCICISTQQALVIRFWVIAPKARTCADACM